MAEGSGETQHSEENETGQESLFLIPACLQPRRIIDRVRGFVGGGRPSATTTKKRLREQRQRLGQNQSVSQADRDNSTAPMKTDSKADSGETLGQIGIVRQRYREEEAGVDASAHPAADGEVNSSLPSDPQPGMRPSPQQDDNPDNTPAMMGPFQDLQPIQMAGNEAPSAPPLPCGESHPRTPISTPPPAARQLFDAMSAPNQSRQRPGGHLLPQRLRSSRRSDDVGIDFMNYKSTIARRRRTGNTVASVATRARLGSAVRGYSGAHFSGNRRRSSIPESFGRLHVSGTSDGSRPRLRTDHALLFNSSRGRSPMITEQGQRSPSPSFQYRRNEGSWNLFRGSGNVIDLVTNGSNTDFAASGTENLSPRHRVPLLTNRSNRLTDAPQRTGSRQGLTNNVPSVFEDSEMLSNHDGGRSSARRSVGGIGFTQSHRSGAQAGQSGEPMPISSEGVAKLNAGQDVEVLSQQAEENAGEELLRMRKENKRLTEEIKKLQHMYESEALCQICWDNKKNVLSLPCSHLQYCRKCLEKHWEGKSEKECPLCRQRVNSTLYIHG